MLLIHLSK